MRIEIKKKTINWDKITLWYIQIEKKMELFRKTNEGIKYGQKGRIKEIK